MSKPEGGFFLPSKHCSFALFILAAQKFGMETTTDANLPLSLFFQYLESVLRTNLTCFLSRLPQENSNDTRKFIGHIAKNWDNGANLCASFPQITFSSARWHTIKDGLNKAHHQRTVF
jgi:hypothetical protein